VTVDDERARAGYNCHGFALGIGDDLGASDGPAFWKSMAYEPTEAADLKDDDEVVALFRNDAVRGDKWHSAKRLRGLAMEAGLFESKCGTNSHDPRYGLQIIHPLTAIGILYGVVDSYWVRLTTAEADAQRKAILKREFNVDERDPIVLDSSDRVNKQLADLLGI
jgi:hypothetical protein